MLSHSTLEFQYKFCFFHQKDNEESGIDNEDYTYMHFIIMLESMFIAGLIRDIR